MRNFKNLMDFTTFFKTEEKCHNYLKSILWQNGKYCPCCGADKIHEYTNFKKNRCYYCKQDFSIRKGTIFDNSRLPLKKWFMCIYLVNSNKKGITSCQLANQVGITQKTAWFVLQRIREYCYSKDLNQVMGRLTDRKPLEEKKIKVISLFSGCGGLDLGFEGGFDVPKSCIKDTDFIDSEKDEKVILNKNPFDIIFCNDIMAEAKIAFEANFKSNAIYLIKSVADLKGSELPKADLVIGGFPCQDFSLAGKRKGFAADRGRLYQEMARIIREVKPKAFVAENVYGLLSIDGAIETIKKEFSKGGYIVFHYPVEAPNYGVPQTRKRVFFVGVKESELQKKVKEEDFLPKPTHTKKWVALKDIFKNLPEPNKSKDPDQKSYSKAKFYGVNCQGNKAVDMSKPAPTIRAEHHGNIEFRRLENGGNGDDRRLTVREAALIQTFPSSFYFTEKDGKKLLSQSSSYRVVGNAVPPLLAYHFARRLGKLWNEIF